VAFECSFCKMDAPESPLPLPSTTFPFTTKAVYVVDRPLFMGFFAYNVIWQVTKARKKQILMGQSVSFIQ
jgi:hypothetical protein